MPKFTTGFTLVELMVSVTIFSFVMVISMGSILAVLDANHKSQSLRSVMDNLNSTLEGMTRTIRFGSNYHCGTVGDPTVPFDCAGAGDPSITVQDSAGNSVTYSVSGGQMTRVINGGSSFALTSPDVTILTLTFRVFGSQSFPNGNYAQPKVIIVIKGYVAGKALTSSTFTLETTISQRILDVN